MRTEAEIRKAIKHLREGMKGAPQTSAGLKTMEMTARLIHVLEWTLGEKNMFGEALADLERVDRAFRQ